MKQLSMHSHIYFPKQDIKSMSPALQADSLPLSHWGSPNNKSMVVDIRQIYELKKIKLRPKHVSKLFSNF